MRSFTLSGPNVAGTLTLSVKDLVAFSASSGDLVADVPAGPSAQEGIQGHQRLQKARGDEWQSEFSLKQSIPLGQHTITLRGRIDLLRASPTPAIIEEIKTAYVPLDQVPEAQLKLHWAQATVYAYLYHLSLCEKDCADSHYSVKISVYHLRKKRLYSEEKTLDIEQLKLETEALIERFLQWYIPYTEHKQKVVQSAQQLSFPFAQYRRGQHTFARTVFRTIRDKQHLLVQAPTGTGKTLSTLFPALKAMGTEHIEQILYLTAKGSAQETALNTVTLLAEKSGLYLDHLVLRAKEKSCPCRSPDENVRACCETEEGLCAYTLGFFDRLPEARLDCLKARHLSPERLLAIAHKHRICPFELSLQMVRWASLVVGDVNYALDPLVRLSAFDRGKNRRVFLIDEIHNLNDRAREMYSAELHSADARHIAKQLKNQPTLKRHINTIARALLDLEFDERPSHPPLPVIKAVRKTLDSLLRQEPNPQRLFSGLGSSICGWSDWLKQLYRFIAILELYGEAHRCTLQVVKKGTKAQVSLRLLCLDAAPFLQQQYHSARALVGFSATVTPMHFYHRVLGFKNPEAQYAWPAVFPSEHQLTLRCDYIDTRWQAREQTLSELVALIHAVISAREGKYLIFFPSYAYLEMTAAGFAEQHPKYPTVVQRPDSEKSDRDAFLSAFFESDQAVLGFAIMGGVFGEGVDYLGAALDGAVVVGTGMPQPSAEQKLLSNYFEKQGLNGFQYAYQFPGFVRVQQAAGRVIRSEEDRGVVVLVDPRFRRSDYHALMPPHWLFTACATPSDSEVALSTFWASQPHP